MLLLVCVRTCTSDSLEDRPAEQAWPSCVLEQLQCLGPVCFFACDCWDLNTTRPMQQLAQHGSTFVWCMSCMSTCCIELSMMRTLVQMVHESHAPAVMHCRSTAQRLAGRGLTATGDEWRRGPSRFVPRFEVALTKPPQVTHLLVQARRTAAPGFCRTTHVYVIHHQPYVLSAGKSTILARLTGCGACHAAQCTCPYVACRHSPSSAALRRILPYDWSPLRVWRGA